MADRAPPSAFPELVEREDPTLVDIAAGVDPSDWPSRGKIDPGELVPEGSTTDQFVAPPPEEIASRSPADLFKSTRYQDRQFRWTGERMAKLPANIRVIEIARWPVPAGHLGIISYIGTHIGIQITTEGFSGEIGINLPWEPWLHEIIFNNPGLRFWLRWQSTPHIEPREAEFYGSYYDLPGQPFAELPTWTDQRFGYGWSGRETLRLLVPEDSLVRLYVGADRICIPCETHEDCPRGWKCIDGCCEPGAPSDFLPGGALDPEAEAVKVSTPGRGIGSPRTVPAWLLQKLAASSPASSGAIAAEAAGALADPSPITPTFAGRIVGTLQAYRENDNAIESARRGL